MKLESFTWAVAEGESEGRTLLIRFREFPTTFGKEALPERLNIFWTMSESEDWGLPTPAEMERLATFESRLVDAVERDQHSVLSVVLTCNGQREFVFHTADVGEFLKRLTNMPQEDQRYRIELHRNEDMNWEYDASVVPAY